MSKTKELIDSLHGNGGDDYENQYHLEALRQEEEWLQFIEQLELSKKQTT